MASKLRRKLSVVVAGLAIIALAACDTEPATDVTADAATLNSKGACAGAYGGSNQYQLRDFTANGGWFDVGPRYRFDCTAATQEVPLNSYRVGGLKPSNAYQFRLVSRLDNGAVQTWDAAGTNGGTNYDWFGTKDAVSAVDEQPAETILTYDPETGGPLASASSCPAPKEIKNIRKGLAAGVLVFKVVLRTQWKYCKGQIRWSSSSASCDTTFVGDSTGFKCLDPYGHEVRSVSYGGNPEHSEYTYSFRIKQTGPGPGGITITWYSSTWCASNAISGSGAHRRTGSCDVTQW
jgi:hypothetical protein